MNIFYIEVIRLKKSYEEILHKKFHRLTILEILPQQKCLCMCECGNEKVAYLFNVLSGRTKSCGCLAKESKNKEIIDLSNQQFGNLKVIERAGYKNGRVAWLCQCQCGKRCVVTSHDLTSGHTKSCGCLKKGKSIKNLQNQEFGYLVALYAMDKRNKKGSVIWKCLCRHCGSYVEVSEDALVHNGYKSCGCLKTETGANLHKALHFYQGTCYEILQRKKRCDNSSGHTGVFLVKGSNRYRTNITFQGKRYNLGVFDTMEEAIAKREDAEEHLFKRFIRCYQYYLNHEEAYDEIFQFDVKYQHGQFYIATNVQM